MRARWRVVGWATALVVGGALGLGLYTFGYAEGWSYFSSDPKACGNCHIMSPQLSSWVKASHHSVATCNDCHLPHGFAKKWLAKGKNGFRHSWAFTFQSFPEPIRITPSNAAALQQRCVDCHRDFVHPLLESAQAAHGTAACVHCHADVGHGPWASLGR